MNYGQSQMNNIMPQQKNNFNYFNNNMSSSIASTNNIIWVQGIEGAKAWQLNPNSMVILLDSEVEGKMYIKTSDNIGMSSLRIFNYVEEIPTNNNVTINKDLDLSQYVKKDELSTMIKEIIANEQFVSTTTGTANSKSSNRNSTDNAKNITILKK